MHISLIDKALILKRTEIFKLDTSKELPGRLQKEAEEVAYGGKSTKENRLDELKGTFFNFNYEL